jgi:hypothetical protein
MPDVLRSAWDQAVGSIFCEFSFAAVGARKSEDWRRDVISVMELKSVDPRGWLSINQAPGPSSHLECSPEMPFLPHVVSDFNWVFEVSRRSAEQILVILQGDWFLTSGIRDFDTKKESLLGSASVILERFGDNADYFTNVSAARDDPHGDMFHHEGAYEGFTDYTMDCGVIAVSDAEVGVFWGFIID